MSFLDRQVFRSGLSTPARHEQCGRGLIESGVQRQALQGWLPEELLLWQEEPFSDGGGYGWNDGLKEHAESVVTDQMLAIVYLRCLVGPP